MSFFIAMQRWRLASNRAMVLRDDLHRATLAHLLGEASAPSAMDRAQLQDAQEVAHALFLAAMRYSSSATTFGADGVAASAARLSAVSLRPPDLTVEDLEKQLAIARQIIRSIEGDLADYKAIGDPADAAAVESLELELAHSIRNEAAWAVRFREKLAHC